MKPDHVPEWGSFIVPYGARIVAPPGPDEVAAPVRPPPLPASVRQRVADIDARVAEHRARIAELLEERTRLMQSPPDLSPVGGIE